MTKFHTFDTFTKKKNALSVEEMFDNQKFVCLINDTLVEENCTFSDCLKTLKETEYFAHLMENMVENLFKNVIYFK